MSVDPAVLIVGGTEQRVRAVADELVALVGDRVSVEAVPDAESATSFARVAAGGGSMVPLALACCGEGLGPPEVVELRAGLRAFDTRIVAVTESASLVGLAPLLGSDAVDAFMAEPWTRSGFAKVVVAQLATYLVAHSPDDLDRFGDLIADDERTRAELRIERRRTAPTHDVDRRHPLLDVSSEDAELEAQLVESLDVALGHPPRIRMAPGTVLIEIGADVGGIFVVLDGVVRLTSRAPGGDQILHEQSTGSIIGLLSLASKRRAMLDCVAVTEVRAIPVTVEQLARALDVDPELSSLLNRVLIGSLARRLRRSDELQVELDQSLSALSAARAELVAQAKMATLGDISAGLAHELNNPTAALGRAIANITDDITAEGLLPADLTAIVRDRAVAEPLSSADVRSLRRELVGVVGDRRLAGRLVDMGVSDHAEARRLADLPSSELDRLEAATRLGSQLHHAGTAARRVQALVDSLRAYVRGEDGSGTWVPDVDVLRTIESALRLLSHRTDEATIELSAESVPAVPGRPGALQVVWSNLVTNALDALADSDNGQIEITVTPTDDRRVRVTVADNGPGIEPPLADRIFEPRFTTKGGRVRFGLGLGLSICRQIVTEHGGTIAVESRPGRTVFDVRLPVEEPDE
ncbi:MAG: ATP-binding protein [Ilumatobacter fluminis]|uniref:sensor histidine kinase n=1 Tax=Ilumatobacter fluminis TaxID=467091 RepID=UPI0032ECAF7C